MYRGIRPGTIRVLRAENLGRLSHVHEQSTIKQEKRASLSSTLSERSLHSVVGSRRPSHEAESGSSVDGCC